MQLEQTAKRTARKAQRVLDTQPLMARKQSAKKTGKVLFGTYLLGMARLLATGSKRCRGMPKLRVFEIRV